MIVFWAVCALLIVLALAFILPPLRHPDRIAVASTQTQANVIVYRHQLAEMTSDVGHQIMTDEQFLREREELEQRLIADLPGDSRPRRKENKEQEGLSTNRLVCALALGVPTIAIVLYLMLGAPSSLFQSP